MGWLCVAHELSTSHLRRWNCLRWGTRAFVSRRL
jgi:hypothetical protein